MADGLSSSKTDFFSLATGADRLLLEALVKQRLDDATRDEILENSGSAVTGRDGPTARFSADPVPVFQTPDAVRVSKGEPRADSPAAAFSGGQPPETPGTPMTPPAW